MELTDERERHIAENHPDLLPAHRGRVEETLADPDQIRRRTRFTGARLFTRWYDDVRGGKHVVVVVVTEPARAGRHWIVTGMPCQEGWHKEMSNGREADIQVRP